MSRTRRRFTAQQKADLVRRHVVKKDAISDLADEIGLQPSQIYLWINQVLEQAERAFQPNGKSQMTANPDKHRIKELENDLQIKDALLAEMLQQVSRILVDRQGKQT